MPEIRMPRFSDVSDEAVISQWCVDVGDEVAVGEVIAEAETDKATMEVVADQPGTVTSIVVPAGSAATVGDPIAVLDGPAADAPVVTARTPEPVPAGPADTGAVAPTAAPTTVIPATVAPEIAVAASGQSRVKASPYARKLARAAGLNLAGLTGTGPDGRIVADDVRAAGAAPHTGETARSVPGHQSGGLPPEQAPRASTDAGTTEWEDIPLTKLRRTTAARMARSAAEIPQFELRAQVDAEALLAAHADLNSAGGPRISLTDLIVKCCATALHRDRRLNSSWRGDCVRRFTSVAVGVAVATPDGLVVPTVRDADQATIGEIAEQTAGFSARAREGRLRPADLVPATFTVSNLGMLGVDSFTALINPPQAAILAVGAVRALPVVDGNSVAVRRRLDLSLSADHRIIDGAGAAEFLTLLKSLVEQPITALI